MMSAARFLRIALAGTTCLAFPVFAQVAGVGVVRQNIDANGVDLTTGAYNFSVLAGSIGSGDGALSVINYFGAAQGDNQQVYFTRTETGTQVTIRATFGGRAETFTGLKNATSFNSDQGSGAVLTKNSKESYTLVQSDGTVITFTWPASLSFQGGNAGFCSQGNEAYCNLLANTATFKSGKVITYAWRAVANCTTRYDQHGEPIDDCAHSFRMESITNNYGYRISWLYQDNTDPTVGLAPASWRTRVGATLVNTEVASTALTVGYAYPSGTVTQITDTAGRITTVTRDASQYVIGVQLPGSAGNDVAISHTGGIVTQIVAAGITTSYARSVAGTTGTMTVTSPSGQRVVVSDLTLERPTSDRDELLRITSFQYDSKGRLTRTTAPEGNSAPGGNYIDYVYDGRGNITSTTAVAKVGSGLANIVTSATFATDCTTSPASCNKPLATTDARGAVTNYSYDPVHGGVTSVQAPAPTTGAARPETRYSYTLTGGVYLLTGVSACQTGTSCAGTASEVKTTLGYGANRLPTSVSSGAGDGSLTATSTLSYDPYGNLLTVDGPLAGTADTVRYRYDLARQRVGVISPDPDGTGPLKHRAQRTSYNPKGQVTKVETGTVNSQSDAEWSAMVVKASTNLTYDANNRRTMATAAGEGGAIAAVLQYSYDSAGRLNCTAQRMNPAVFVSLPSSACSLGTAGSFGSDRITQTNYDAASQITGTIEALGTASQRTALALTYSANGKLLTLADGNGNKTSYVYDGFDRLSKTQYPTASNGSVSNASDYEQLGYDANSNVTSRRLRDGQVIAYTYDNLNRLTLKDVPSGAYGEGDITYAYDNLGRLTSVTRPDGHYVNATYDALSRRLTETSYFGTKTSQYDLAGRRIRLDYPGNFYVTYDVDTLGEVTAIRENGAASGIGVLATFGYDDLGRRTSLTRGNGTSTAYSYDAALRLTTLTQQLAGTAQDLTVTLGSYNPAGQIGSKVSSNDVFAWTAHYNVSRPYTANGLNQYTVAGATAFGYDARGNLTVSGSVAYTYTSENRLSAAGSSLIYYDPVGRILLNSHGSVSERFDYDGDAMIVEMDGNGAVVRRYVHGPWADEPLVWYEGSGTSDRRWLHADERGSIVAVSDASGTALAVNSYSEYGINGTVQYGRFGYTGQAWFADAGLYWYKARHYSPTLGRFLQTDPTGYDDGPNWYNYVGSDPVNATDPSGMLWVETWKRVCVEGNCGWRSYSDWYEDPTDSFDNGERASGTERADGGAKVEDIVVTASKQQPAPPCDTRAIAFANSLAQFADGANRAGDAALVTAGALAVAGAVITPTIVGAPAGLTAEGAAAALVSSSAVMKAFGTFAAVGGELLASSATSNRTSIGAAIFVSTVALIPFQLGPGGIYFQDKIADAAGKAVGFGKTPYMCPSGK